MQEKLTIKSESEKMIPLDTSGNSVDVEIKEESSTPENEVEVKDAVITEVVEEKSAETPTEELEEYSAGVKKRIDKLTKKMREAERREEAAIVYAKNVNEKYKQALSTSALKDDTYLRNAEDRFKEAIERDSEYAIGHFNLACVYDDLGNYTFSKYHLDKAKEYGFDESEYNNRRCR